MVADALDRAGVTTGILLDVGCGSGNLYPFVRDRLSSYIGVDIVRYDGFPAAAKWVEANLEQLPLPLPQNARMWWSRSKLSSISKIRTHLCANSHAW